jgi:hypothetical protein
MQSELEHNWGVRYGEIVVHESVCEEIAHRLAHRIVGDRAHVLYDRPPAFFKRLSVAEAHEVRLRFSAWAIRATSNDERLYGDFLDNSCSLRAA